MQTLILFALSLTADAFGRFGERIAGPFPRTSLTR